MVRVQMLNYILDNKDEELLNTYNVEFFKKYEKEYEFIKNHYLKYKVIPDKETFLEKFEDFDSYEVKESRKYLQDKLVELYYSNRAVDIVNEGNKLIQEDAIKAVNYIQHGLATISAPKKVYGVDIVKNAKDRYNAFLDRYNAVDIETISFSTGLPELDEVLGRIRRKEEFIVLYARTNNGKSFIAEKIAVSVWEAKHNVGFFSPEMSGEEVGYRFDTLYKNFSNYGFRGTSKDFPADKYSTYTNNLGKMENAFSVTTPISFDKEVTVSKIRDWVINENLELIVLDGLSYLYDERSNNRAKETDRLTNISEDLVTLSMELEIPIIAVVQANRVGARDNEGEVNNDAPELDTIRNSDGISHNATRAISVKQKDDVLILKLTKNRYGKVGSKLIYNWIIDTGKFTYLDNPKSGLSEEETKKKTKEVEEHYIDNEDIF